MGESRIPTIPCSYSNLYKAVVNKNWGVGRYLQYLYGLAWLWWEIDCGQVRAMVRCVKRVLLDNWLGEGC